MDQETIPAVDVPLGDFFGTAPGYNLFRTTVLGMTEKRMYANWYMPYSSGVKIDLINESKITLPLRFSYRKEALEKVEADRLLRFHAKWHTGDIYQLEKKDFLPNGQRWPDQPLLLTKNTGRFCGVHLHVLNQWMTPKIENESWWYGHGENKTVDWWWGEGDEKFFVDNEKFPSTFGTGSEDYVGYAWAAEPPFALFDSAYAAQPLMPLDGNGHTSVLRLQICDNIPYQNSFEAFIEKYKPDYSEENNTCIYEITPFWYQAKNTADFYKSPNKSTRLHTL